MSRQPTTARENEVRNLCFDKNRQEAVIREAPARLHRVPHAYRRLPALHTAKGCSL
jgi:hypothetical protein